MPYLDTPSVRVKIDIAKEYSDKIKFISSDYSDLVARIWRDHIAIIKRATLSGGNVDGVISSLIAQLREVLSMLIDDSMRVACNREDVPEDIYLPLLPLSVQQCNIAYYDGTLDHYGNILSQEVRFAIENGFIQDMDLFLMNPSLYMASMTNGLLRLKEGITDVSKGVSYSFADNMKKMTISVAALVYTNSMMELWKSNGNIVAYFGVRNSNYPCALCDRWAHVVIPMSGGMIYPLHNRCVCSIVPLLQSELQ